METGIAINSSMVSAWLPWLMAGVLCVILLSCILQPRFLHGLLSNGFASFADGTAEQIPSVGSQIGQWAVNIIVPAVSVYVAACQDVDYTGELLGMVLLVALGVDALRLLVTWLVQYTFRIPKVFPLGYMRYFSLRSIYTFVLIALVLWTLSSIPSFGWIVVAGVVSGVYILLLCIQLGRMYCRSVVDVSFLLMYLLTVEALPYLLIYRVFVMEN